MTLVHLDRRALFRTLWAVTGLCALLVACSPPERRAELPRNVIVFCLDTVRADRMGPYGAPRPTTPAIDRLAATGAVFEDAQSPAPWTLPSVATLLTGLEPTSHGAGLSGPLRDLGKTPPTGLAPQAVTLAERFSEAGYRCEAFVTNPLCRSGLERGFEAFHYRRTEGSDVATFAVDAIERLAPGPFFLWLHFMDAHDPLFVPAEYALAVTRPEGDPNGGAPFARSLALHDHAGFREERLVLYDAAIRYMDRQIDRVLARLERLDLADGTLVVVVSDHGEEILDHVETARAAGYTDPRGILGIGHGQALFVEQLHVPLILTGPGVVHRRIPELVSLADVAPTLLELTGVGRPERDLDGRSLVPLLEGSAWEERALIAGSLAYGPDRRAWIGPEWKLILGGENEAALLYRRRDDPLEARDLAESEPELVQELGRRLRVESASSVERGRKMTFDREDLQALRALGYLGD